MSITAYGSGSRATSAASTQFKSLKDTLGTLQTQLSSGKVATTYSGLGSGATLSLSLNAKLSSLDGYSSAITTAQNRVNIAATGLQSVSDLAGSLGADLSGSFLTDAAQRGQAQTLAQGDMAQVIDVLNSDVNGTYIFSGAATDTQPVASLDAILNGADGLKGVTQVVSDRITADLGSGEGGLTTTATGSNVAIASENATTDYGFVISSATSSNAAITVTPGTGTPPSTTLGVTAQPNTGDTISLNLTLPDGTTKTLTLTAGSSTSDSGDTFAIGVTTDDTAANIKTALDKLLTTSSGTDLSAASTMRATTDFFDGNYPSDEVVDWYKGDDNSGSARDTYTVGIGDDQSVSIGMRANETGLKTILSSLAAIAVTSFPSTDTEVDARFNALASRTSSALLGDDGRTAVDNMTTDLSVASTTLGSASDRVSASKAQVQDSISTVEDVDTTETAQKLLAVQNQLQASYQTTAAIAKLSLTDYLS